LLRKEHKHKNAICQQGPTVVNECWIYFVFWRQGCSLYSKNHSNYPASFNTAEILSAVGEMTERGETKFGGNFYENSQIIDYSK